MRTLSAYVSDLRFRKFLIVGASNTVIAYLVFIGALELLSGFAWRGAVAQGVAYCVATIWSFYWNRTWSFRSDGAVGGEAGRFLLTQACCLASSSAGVGVLVDIAGFPPTPAWVAVTGAVVLLNFTILRLWVFRAAGRAGRPE